MRTTTKISICCLLLSSCFLGGIFADSISSFTRQKVLDFMTERVKLKDESVDAAVKGIEEIQKATMAELEENSLDYEQEKCILESLYFMEIYERSVTDENRKEMREKMRKLMERNFKCIDSRDEGKISEWLYQVCGDVTSYYMTRSIAATFHYGMKVKSMYESAVKINPVMPQGNVSLGNWYFFAPGIFGGSNKKAERCYKNAVKGAEQSGVPGEKFIAYEYLSQLYFEEEKDSLYKEMFSKFKSLGIGVREVGIAENCNANGYSFYQYMRNKSAIDKELPESEKDEADKKKS
ncbi:MAG: hypothetical protein IJ717_06405 [Treponema sp.]|nr:hypothetical protein [Treponema sp.]